MTFQRQTHLGSTGTKYLTIVDFVPPSSLAGNEFSSYREKSTTEQSHMVLGIPATKTFIFQLPDELLVPIVELAAGGPGVPSRVQHATIYNTDVILILSKVCKRLRRLSQQLLYCNICVERSMVPPSVQISKLHRTLRERKDLRRHCISLHVRIPDVGTRYKGVIDYLVAENFADWLTKTRRLSIHGGFDDGRRNERTWNLISRMTSNFKDLEQVRIDREGWGLYLPSIFKWLACPRLKALELHGISEWKHGSVELEPEKRRSASFTSLRISDYDERPEATFQLLQWPAVLTHFEFGSFYNNPHIMDYPMFENWLLIHQNSLTYIDIGYLHGASRLFNAMLFPNLEFLRLSRWQMHSPIQFSPQDSNVLGPRLKTFAWDFNIYDQHSEGWCAFGEPEAKWVKDLAECAVSHKAALARIEIRFAPDSFLDTTEEMGYPWDRMDRVSGQTLKPNGLDLVYNKPPISRDAWLKFVRTRELDGDEDEAVVDDIADNEQSSVADEQQNADTLEPDFQCGYQGEDIRGYLVSRLKAS